MMISKTVSAVACATALLLSATGTKAQVVEIGAINFIQHPAPLDLHGLTSTATVGGMSLTWSGDTDFDTSGPNLVTTNDAGTIFGAFDSTTQASLNSSDVVWVSMTMRTANTSGTNRFGLYYASASIDSSVTAGQRLSGVQFRAGPFVDAEEIIAGATSEAGEVFTSSGWSANTYYTLTARIAIDRAVSAADTVQFYFVPGQDSFDFDDPGSPYATLTGTDFIGPSDDLLGVALHGNQAGVNYSYLNVAVASAVPEPSTYAAIFGSVALGLAAWRRHRRRPHHVGAGLEPEHDQRRRENEVGLDLNRFPENSRAVHLSAVALAKADDFRGEEDEARLDLRRDRLM